jgi:hypothetical protein
MEAQERLIEHARRDELLVDLLLLGHPAEFVVQGNGDLGLEELLLLLLYARREGRCCHGCTPIVA